MAAHRHCICPSHAQELRALIFFIHTDLNDVTVKGVVLVRLHSLLMAAKLRLFL